MLPHVARHITPSGCQADCLRALLLLDRASDDLRRFETHGDASLEGDRSSVADPVTVMTLHAQTQPLSMMGRWAHRRASALQHMLHCCICCDPPSWVSETPASGKGPDGRRAPGQRPCPASWASRPASHRRTARRKTSAAGTCCCARRRLAWIPASVCAQSVPEGYGVPSLHLMSPLPEDMQGGHAGQACNGDVWGARRRRDHVKAANTLFVCTTFQPPLQVGTTCQCHGKLREKRRLPFTHLQPSCLL